MLKSDSMFRLIKFREDLTATKIFEAGGVYNNFYKYNQILIIEMLSLYH